MNGTKVVRRILQLTFLAAAASEAVSLQISTPEAPRDPLLDALHRGDLAQLRAAAITNPNSLGPALVRAAEMKNEPAVRLLLECGANPNFTRPALRLVSDRKSQSLDLVAVANGQDALTAAVLADAVNIVRLLLEKGATVNRRLIWRNPTGITKKTHAGPSGISVLIHAVNPHPEREATPLLLAAAMRNTEVIALLLSAGADPSLSDEFGLTAAEFIKASQFPKESTGKITVYRIKRFIASANEPVIRCDGEVVSGAFDNGRKHTFTVPAGPHDLQIGESNYGSATVKVRTFVSPGEHQYFSIRAEMAPHTVYWQVQRVSETDGLRESAKMKLDDAAYKDLAGVYFSDRSLPEERTGFPVRHLGAGEAAVSARDASGPADAAIVWIYRMDPFKPTIFVNGGEVARIRGGRYLRLRLKPGRTSFHAGGLDHKEAVLELRPRTTYYVRSHSTFSGEQLTSVDPARATADMAKMKHLEEEWIRDTGVVAPGTPPDSQQSGHKP